uniref:Toxin, PemK superfamily n=1 Tax=Polaromonas sp. H8N TaxID=1840297 RepID=A0A2S1FIC3_9BURK|nr:type II toxin-antitoxin system PemK/MazF family toxin [Polaromonas sp. H8N]AWD72274.1 toxin, PemK superfamily [Polaromonas sp. H8N]
MAIHYHPEQGTILVCDFTGFIIPEMTKRRPVVVVSPRLRRRSGLCTVVPLSTTDPNPVEPYHYRLHTIPPLPSPYDKPAHWVKTDMVYTVSFERLFLMRSGMGADGKRIYDQRVIDKADMLKIQAALLHGIGLTNLTDYL